MNICDKDNALNNDPNQSRNLFVLALHNILLRLAWVFKTETVIMPAFLDIISGAGWVRGWLPVLNRIGQSIPPVLFSETLMNSRKKVTMLFVTTLLMGILFGTIALGCTQLGAEELAWFPFLFLILYGIFFAATGVNQLAFNTLQGKLVAPSRRGRLMSIAGGVGSIVAISAALTFLQPWLAIPNGRGFVFIFGFTATGFIVAAFTLFFIREPVDQILKKRSHPILLFKNAWQTFQQDQTFRKAAWVAMLLLTILLLFPHFQWLGRTKLNANASDLMLWVVLQNISVGFFSWVAGYFADRIGYRLVIRILVFLIAMIPILAISITASSHPHARSWYAITFFLLGLCPVAMKSILNYVLELSSQQDHPRYLSTISLCMAIPMLFSPGVGFLVDWNHNLVFLVVSVCIFTSGLLTFGMKEPRKQKRTAIDHAG